QAISSVAPALAQLALECKGCPGTFCKGCHESEQTPDLPGAPGLRQHGVDLMPTYPGLIRQRASAPRNAPGLTSSAPNGAGASRVKRHSWIPVAFSREGVR